MLASAFKKSGPCRARPGRTGFDPKRTVVTLENPVYRTAWMPLTLRVPVVTGVVTAVVGLATSALKKTVAISAAHTSCPT